MDRHIPQASFVEAGNVTTVAAPLAIDLFCGLGGWTDGLLAAGFDVVGFDITRHRYADMNRSTIGGKPLYFSEYPAQLVLQDILTVHGFQFRNAAVIVASPPCQNYSYLAMPWSRSSDPENSKAAKALRKKWETEGPDNRLFDVCFRIQREACEAAGRYIPLIVENVRGAVPWVGREKAKFGSFYLWGDVEQIGNRVVAGRDLADIRAGRGRFGMGVAPEKGIKGHGSTWFGIQNNGDTYDQRTQNPVSGMKGTKPVPNRGWTAGTAITLGLENYGGSEKGAWDNKTPGRLRRDDSLNFGNGTKVPGQIQGKEYAMCRTGAEGQTTLGVRDGNRRDDARDVESGGLIGSDGIGDDHGGTKSHGGVLDGVGPKASTAGRGKAYGGDFGWDGSAMRTGSSKSNARKAASALIAKIPLALSEYVAKSHFPQDVVL